MRKYMIHSRLLNVWDRYVKSHLAQVGIDAQAPYISCQIQWTQPAFHGTIISRKYDDHKRLFKEGGGHIFESCDISLEIRPLPRTQLV